MGFLVSPGVDVNEIDMTNVIPAVSTSIGGYAGPFRWGPVDQIVTVSSEKDLVSVYGKPDAEYSASFFTAASFLKYGNTLKVSRSFKDSMRNSIAVSVSATAAASVNAKFIRSLDELATAHSDTNFTARYPGILGDSLSVIILTSTNTDEASKAYLNQFDYIPTTNDEIHVLVIDSVGKFTGSAGTVIEKFAGLSVISNAKKSDGTNNYYKSIINNSSEYIFANKLSSAITNADIATEALSYFNIAISAASVTLGTITYDAAVFTAAVPGMVVSLGAASSVLKFQTKYNTADISQITILSISGNVITLTAITTAGTAVPIASIIEVAGLGVVNLTTPITPVVSITNLAIASVTSTTIVILTAANTSLKVGMGVTLKSVTGTVLGFVGGVKSYIKSIGADNKTITFTIAASSPIQVTDLLTFTDAFLQFQMAHGSDSTFATVADGGTVDAIGLFADTDLVDVNLLFCHATTSDVVTTSDQTLQALATKRKDCIAFISAPLNISSKTSENERLKLLTGATGKFTHTTTQPTRDSYSVFDSTPLYIYNKYLDNYLWIPACGHMAGLCANTDDVAEPWFSPAGYTRGQLFGVTKLGFNPNQNSRDDLYKAGINPIVSFPGQGIILFGDKTAQAKPSAFDRINVRRLFIVLEKAIATASKYQLFELNDEFTRAMFRNMVEPFLRDVKGRRGITDFLVVCDETNNTGEVIDTNRFVADIYIKPARSINFITLNFIATRTGVEFSEIVGK